MQSQLAYSNKPSFEIPSSKLYCDANFKSPQLSSRLSQSINIIPADLEDSQCVMLQKQDQRDKWIKGGLKILFFITKFIKQMKTNSTKLKFKQLTKSQVKLISDLGSDHHVLLDKPSKYQHIIDWIKYLVKLVPVFQPDSLFRLVWDIMVLLIVLINIFFIPLKLGFSITIKEFTSSLLLEQLPSWIFILDIVIKANTAFYKQGKIYKSRDKILSNYAQTDLLGDVIIVIPFILSAFYVPYMEYILLLRVTKIITMIESIETQVNPKESIQTVFELVKSIFFIMYLTHFCSCIWNLIGEYGIEKEDTSWLVTTGIQNADWQTKYINSLYFTTVTTLTVGYGDIVPKSNLERLYVVMMALVICGVLGYTISSIANILKTITEKDQQFKQKMMHINRYLKKKNLNQQLQLQVKKYFEYLLKKQNDTEVIGEEIMGQLTKNLKQQVAINLYQAILQSSRALSRVLTQDSILELCGHVNEKQYAPEDTIIAQGEIPDKLIFLLSGQLILTCQYSNKETIVSHVKENKPIGEREFLIQNPYDYSIKADSFCSVAYISFDKLLTVINKSDHQVQQFRTLKDSLVYGDQINFGQICYICSWTHRFTKCPFVFNIPNQNKILSQLSINCNQERGSIKRNPNKTRQNNLVIKEDALALVLNYNIMEQHETTDELLRKIGLKPQLEDNININQSDKLSSLESSQCSKLPARTTKRLSIRSIASQEHTKQGIMRNANKLFSHINGPSILHNRHKTVKFDVLNNQNSNTIGQSQKLQKYKVDETTSLADKDGIESYASKKYSKHTNTNNNNTQSKSITLFTKSVTEFSEEASMVEILEEEIQYYFQRGSGSIREDFDIDKFHNYETFNPLNNIDKIIQSLQSKAGQVPFRYQYALKRRKYGNLN